MKIFTVFMLAVGLVCPNVEACKRIKAALFENGNSYFFFGDEFIGVNYDFHQVTTGKVDAAFRVYSPDAAFIWNHDRKLYFFADKYFFSPYMNNLAVDASHFGGPVTRFFDGGLDAAADLDRKTIFFKDCHYVESLPKGPSEPKPFPEGIPCNVDAALTYGQDIKLFKDDQSWEWSPQSGVSGPVKTDTWVHFDHVTLCKEGESEDDEPITKE